MDVSALTLVVYALFAGIVLVTVVVPFLLLSAYYGLGRELRLLAWRTRLDRWTALLAVGVAGAVFGGLRSLGPYPDGGWFVVGAAVFVLGVFLLSVAVANYDWYRALDVPTDETGFVHDGPVQVAGGARPVGEPLIGPFSGEPCVAYAASVVESRWSTRGSISAPIALETDATRFYVDDGSGGLLVDPEDADVLCSPPGSGVLVRDVTTTVGSDERPPEHVRSTLDDLEIDAASSERTYRESHVQPGDEVYVVGSCELVGHGYEANRVVTSAGDATAFVVTAGSLERVTASVRDFVVHSAALGFLLAGSGGFLMGWLLL